MAMMMSIRGMSRGRWVASSPQRAAGPDMPADSVTDEPFPEGGGDVHGLDLEARTFNHVLRLGRWRHGSVRAARLSTVESCFGGTTGTRGS